MHNLIYNRFSFILQQFNYLSKKCCKFDNMLVHELMLVSFHFLIESIGIYQAHAPLQILGENVRGGDEKGFDFH